MEIPVSASCRMRSLFGDFNTDDVHPRSLSRTPTSGVKHCMLMLAQVAFARSERAKPMSIRCTATAILVDAASQVAMDRILQTNPDSVAYLKAAKSASARPGSRADPGLARTKTKPFQ
eukprot:4875198-Pleurochrysis_carterae.AAC.5